MGGSEGGGRDKRRGRETERKEKGRERGSEIVRSYRWREGERKKWGGP